MRKSISTASKVSKHLDYTAIPRSPIAKRRDFTTPSEKIINVARVIRKVPVWAML
jgi:hypothetical protein